MHKTVAFCTLGCKVNQYDAQAMLELFQAAGYASVPFSAIADVYVVNTCTVTGTGDQKSRQMIRRAKMKNPQAAIVVTGCLAQRAADAMAKEGACLVLGTQRRADILLLLKQAMAQEQPLLAVEPFTDPTFEPLSIRKSEGRTRATIKIQEGCDNHCTYCIIPSVRGPVRSRSLADVYAETCCLAEAGYQEIVVSGIHLASYGRDDPNGSTLIDALREIHRVEGIRRIRLGSLEPLLITESFVAALSRMPKICPQFMLALQSGSDAVLSLMGRRYTKAQYEMAVQLLRREYPKADITTDIMTGFPGETDEAFQETLAFVERIGFGRIHVFPYSEREGTVAATMKGAVPKNVRTIRAATLIALGNRLEAAFIGTWRDSAVEVLFEEKCGESAVGYTKEYIRVIANGTPGMIQTVHITSCETDHLMGDVIPGDNNS